MPYRDDEEYRNRRYHSWRERPITAPPCINNSYKDSTKKWVDDDGACHIETDGITYSHHIMRNIRIDEYKQPAGRTQGFGVLMSPPLYGDRYETTPYHVRTQILSISNDIALSLKVGIIDDTIGNSGHVDVLGDRTYSSTYHDRNIVIALGVFDGIQSCRLEHDGTILLSNYADEFSSEGNAVSWAINRSLAFYVEMFNISSGDAHCDKVVMTADAIQGGNWYRATHPIFGFLEVSRGYPGMTSTPYPSPVCS